MKTSFEMAFELHMIKVINKNSNSGQLLEFGMRYFNAMWCIVSLMKISLIIAFGPLKVKITY
jgi:hypothetical protein